MRLSWAVVAACSMVARAAFAAPPPPASAFGRLPAIVTATISPDGRRVAILGGASDQRSVSIATIDHNELPVVPLGDIEGVDLQWAGNDFLLARIAIWQKLGPRLEYRFERNVSISPEGKVLSRLLGSETVSEFITGQPVVGLVPGPPLRVLVEGLTLSIGPNASMNTKITRKGVERPFVRALWSVDPVTGKGALSERGDYDAEGWEVDASGQARIEYKRDELAHGRSVMGRAKGASQWSKIWTEGGDDSDHAFLGYSDPDDAAYLFEDGRLLRRRLSDAGTQLVGGPYVKTSVSLIQDEHLVTAVGVRIWGEKPTVEWFDPELGAVFASLKKIFKTNGIYLGWSKDRSRYVVEVHAATAPPAWYLFDKPHKELSPLGEEYPELKGIALGPVRQFSYKARDGLDIPAYLTLPASTPEKVRLPLIVLPHRGPATFDDGTFDYLAQFLASRGYAVLQPQFRGSGGFGQAFENAGRGEWAGKMQTDLLDGIASVAASTEVDAARVCIVGAGFGGYAALAGAALHPEAYRCAASINGVSDLGLMLVESKRLYGKDSESLESWRRSLGNATTAKLLATSPARLAASVRAPLLLIHGDKDTVFPIEQSQVMVEAMNAVGKPVEFVTLVGETHYLTKSTTRTQMLEALGAFLAKNLPVQAP